MSLTLCGFAASNYYNKVKLALLEKGIPFSEEFVFPSDDPAFVAASPRGKVPFIRVGERTLCESQAIVEYLEDAYPATPLYPADAWDRAQSRALLQLIEVYVELVARRLYPSAFFGLPLPAGLKDQVAVDLKGGIKALKRCVRFEPYIGGNRFDLVDVVAVCHLPLASAAASTIYGEDWFSDLPGLQEYLAMVSQRPHVVAVEKARKEGMGPFVAAVKKKYGMA